MHWFKHDSDASIDVKLKRVRMKYGMEGYGLYWYCLENIARGVDANNFTFELEEDAEIIAHDTGINYQIVNEMMSFMVDLGLFEQSEGRVTCLKMLKRLDQSMVSNPKMREIIKKGKNNHDSVMTVSCKNRIEEKRIDKNREREKKTPRPKSKAIQLSDEFYVTDKMAGWAVEANIASDVINETYKFKDHFIAKGDTKKDWVAAWRNWMRRADEFQTEKQARQSGYEHKQTARQAVEQAINNPGDWTQDIYQR